MARFVWHLNALPALLLLSLLSRRCREWRQVALACPVSPNLLCPLCHLHKSLSQICSQSKASSICQLSPCQTVSLSLRQCSTDCCLRRSTELCGRQITGREVFNSKPIFAGPHLNPCEVSKQMEWLPCSVCLLVANLICLHRAEWITPSNLLKAGII